MGNLMSFWFAYKIIQVRKKEGGEYANRIPCRVFTEHSQDFFYLLFTSLVRSVLVKYRTSVFLHGPWLAGSIGPY